MSDEDAEIKALRQALQQERGQIEAIEFEDPKEEDLAKGIMVTMRCLEPAAAAIFLERLRAIGRAFIHRRNAPPGAIAADMPVVEALSLATTLLIDRTPEGPVLHDYANTEEAVAKFLAVLDR